MSIPTTYTYAAYNAAPADLAERPALEEGWYDLLRSEQLIGGLELGYGETLHPGGPARLARLLDPGWVSTVTTIPGTLVRTRRGEAYGLASTDDGLRALAVASVRTLFDEIAELQQRLGERVVSAVMLHSAPRAGGDGGADLDALFAASLGEIASWAWGDILLVVEHADALVSGHEPEKGYLSLDREITAAARASERSGRVIGHSVNWGRSAIEARSRDGALRHIAELTEVGALRGLVYSGASGEATPVSREWQDVHLPVDTVEGRSLLTATEMERALDEAGSAPLAFLGVKVGASAGTASPRERLAAGLATLEALDRSVTRRAAPGLSSGPASR